jgi:hypothetical protein
MSEAEKAANFAAYAADLVDMTIQVNGIVTDHSEKLTEDGSTDVVRALKANGWMPSRAPDGAVRESVFVARMNGVVVTVDAKLFADRSVSRGGAQGLWDRTDRKKWFIVKDPEASE